MRSDHPLLKYAEVLVARQPLRMIKSAVSAYLAYPIAERLERRNIRPKLDELRCHYSLPMAKRRQIALDRLAEVLEFSMEYVPYYRDVFNAVGFKPSSVRKDPRYMQDIPCLTKDIIREQGARLFSQPLDSVRHHERKTGGSTGLSCIIYYDQDGLDYSAAVTLFVRERIGKIRHKQELHFACRFPDADVSEWLTREDFKSFAMNRTNIFFDRLDDAGLEEIWQTLRRRRPYLVHAHPSTIYALASYVEKKYSGEKVFEVFESSGELLEPYQRQYISRILHCSVVNRYGLAELGVMAYELNGPNEGLQILDSEGWPESIPVIDSGNSDQELVFTGFRNRLMPLIRYRTGDIANVEERERGFFLTNVVGRIHDMVPIAGIDYPTHNIQDMLDHRVGGIQEFQIDLRTSPPTLNIVAEPTANVATIRQKVDHLWGRGFTVAFVTHADLVRVGRLSKFRHVVHP